MDNNIQEIRKKNLRKLIDNQFNGSVNAFAKHIKRPSGFFYDAFADKRPLGERVMRAVENELGLDPYIMDASDKDGFAAKKFELVNVYATRLSGSSNNIFDEESLESVPVNAEVIIKNGWQFENLCCFSIQGDSMAPTLPDSSKILIDTVQHDIIDNKIYALRNGNQIFIKRLYKVFNQSKIIAKSDNSSYPELQFDLSDESSDIKIIGRAVLKLEELL